MLQHAGMPIVCTAQNIIPLLQVYSILGVLYPTDDRSTPAMALYKFFQVCDTTHMHCVYKLALGFAVLLSLDINIQIYSDNILLARNSATLCMCIQALPLP